MLGIIIGVMAVIVIVGLGNGMTRSMRDSFSAMGTNTLSIQVWGYGSRTVSVDDMYKIVDKNPELFPSISPELDFSRQHPQGGHYDLPLRTSVYGVDEGYTQMKSYTLAKGRNIQYMDIADNKQICVIGDYINRTAYGGNAVGQTIKLGAYKFRIVGVLAPKLQSATSRRARTMTASTCPTPRPCGSPTPARRKLRGCHEGREQGQRGQSCRGERPVQPASRATVPTMFTVPASGWKR